MLKTASGKIPEAAAVRIEQNQKNLDKFWYITFVVFDVFYEHWNIVLTCWQNFASIYATLNAMCVIQKTLPKQQNLKF